MLVLGIESTCDETSASIVKDGNQVLSNIIASQIKDHAPWQGVVPEIASRLHIKKIIPVIEDALKVADVTIGDIGLIAAANRPGLIGGLAVGVSCAKAIAWMNNIPFIGINHIEAHLYSPHLNTSIAFPYIGLLASGGHTMITVNRSFTDYEVIGTTIDDAAGEAFDKIAKHYNLGYPGGPKVEQCALNGNPKAYDFPLSNLYKTDRKFDVSYSGLKTAVINHLDKYRKIENPTLNDIAASFQKRAFDILYKKIELAAVEYGIPRVVVAGGVSANRYLRQLFGEMKNTEVYFPDLKYATDNGAMIAGYGYHRYLADGPGPLNTGVFARVPGYKISLEEGYRCR